MSQGMLNLRFAKDESGPAAATDLYQHPPQELAGHVLFGGGGKSVGLMTAEAPRFPVTDRSGNEGLKKRLTGMGLKYEATHGSYGGPENSFIIHGPTREQLHQLSHEYGQEAYVYGEGGKHELHYANGPNEGKYHPSLPTVRYTQTQPEDYYTTVPGKGHVTLHFAHDTLLPSSTPQGAESPVAKSISIYPIHHRMNYRRTVGHGVLLTGEEHARLSGFAKGERSIDPEDLRKTLLERLYLVLRKNTK